MIPKGTKKELRYALCALRACRTHLSFARVGLKGGEDEEVLYALKVLAWREEDLMALLAGEPEKRKS